MKIQEALRNVILSPNMADRKPVFETYDKNVQGNTVWERGRVSASVVAPFRNFPELAPDSSRISVALAPGGNPDLARIDPQEAAKSAVLEGLIATCCVGGEPLCVTDCLNFGNPEKPDQMGEFVEAIEGLKEVCEFFEVPIVSGNVSLYNESGGKSIPPSALVTVFSKVQNPNIVSFLDFQKPGQSIFYLGQRSENLGASEFLKVHQKKDTRIVRTDFSALKSWIYDFQKAVTKGLVTTARPIGKGGLLSALTLSTFSRQIGWDLQIENLELPEPHFLFSEDLGVVFATDSPQEIKDIFRKKAHFLGLTKDSFSADLEINQKKLFQISLPPLKNAWGKVLRNIF